MAVPNGKKPEFSRIEFLKLSGVVAGGAAMILLSRRRTYAEGVYPPGALPSGEFEAACLRCARCVEVCDQQALDSGIDGLPRINGINGYCDFCMDCVEACPTTALSPVSVEQPVIGVVSINQNRCLAWQWPSCRLCYERCMELYEAIHLDDDWRPMIDMERCVGCGACVEVCPVSMVNGENKLHGKAICLFNIGEVPV